MQSGLMTLTLVLQAFLAAETVAGVLLTVFLPNPFFSLATSHACSRRSFRQTSHCNNGVAWH